VLPQAALLCLIHLQILLLVLAYSRAANSDQGGIKDRALLYRHAGFLGIGFHYFVDEVFCEPIDLPAEFAFLKQVSEGQNRGLIGDSVAD
jgi:hypothetical protein